MRTKTALLLILLVFALTPMIASLATFNIPTINKVSLTEATAYNVVFEIQPCGDPVDDPVGPGGW